MSNFERQAEASATPGPGQYPWQVAWARIQAWKVKGFAPEARPAAVPAPWSQSAEGKP